MSDSETHDGKGIALHWKVLIGMALGAVLGIWLQTRDTSAWIGASFEAAPGGVQVASLEGGSPAAKGKLKVGGTYRLAIRNRAAKPHPMEDRFPLTSAADVDAVLDRIENGEVLWFFPARDASDTRAVTDWDAKEEGPRPVAAAMDPGSSRARWIYPFAFAADIFIALLKMLIVPLVMASIVAGVAGVGTMKDLRRLGGKTFAYYIGTSLLAILVGQILVTIIQPGTGAELGLAYQATEGAGAGGFTEFIEVIKRMVPSNVIEAMTDNGAMLSIIFFAITLGFFITRTSEPHSTRVRELFESLLEVMMSMAKGVLSLLPYGVFALMVKVTASTGIEPFKALAMYMITVTLALVIHACVTLPMVLKFVGSISPIGWARAMSPALMTAFSTSSSAMTLPATMESVEHRGKVSNKVTSFTLPLGATVNMDGTALYECIGVIFLAQYYASAGGDPLTLWQQGFVVILALLASIGAAGIPSAGLVMMLTILTALGLPVEGAALLLAVDRPLDMLRTVVNVWSDSCGAAVIARSEGEEGPATAGAVP
tara:strand:- start:1268 stop:2890 length:1623 start_codon:yes stop_codon:yes gene_type:complete